METSKKKRVCITHLDLGIGGAEQLMVHLACGLQKKGHTVSLFYWDLFIDKKYVNLSVKRVPFISI